MIANSRIAQQPWLTRSPRESDIWTSALAVHNVNRELLAALPSSAGTWSHLYAGIFAVDALRTRGGLICHVKAAGIGGVINFPSVSFFDGEANATFDRLSLGMDREIDCLEACARGGLRVGGVVRSMKAAQKLLSIGADFLIVHNGPPVSKDKSSVAEAEAGPRKIPIFLMSELIENLFSPKCYQDQNLSQNRFSRVQIAASCTKPRKLPG